MLDSAGNILVLRRSPSHPDLAGQPDFPGGMIEPGEEPGLSLRREVMEETGLDIAGAELKLCYAGAEVYKGDSHVRLLYVVKLSTERPKIILSWEHDKADWRPLSDLAKLEKQFQFFYHDALGYIRQHKLLES